MCIVGKARELDSSNALNKERTQRIANRIDWKLSIIVILNYFLNPGQHRITRKHQLLIPKRIIKRENLLYQVYLFFLNFWWVMVNVSTCKSYCVWYSLLYVYLSQIFINLHGHFTLVKRHMNTTVIMITCWKK